MRHLWARPRGWCVGIAAIGLLSTSAAAQRLDPIVYVVRIPAPETHIAVVEARIPTANRASIDVMMPVWSPGYYVREDYAKRVQRFVARAPNGDSLAVEQPQPNHWRIATRGAATITLTYELQCGQRERAVGDEFTGRNENDSCDGEYQHQSQRQQRVNRAIGHSVLRQQRGNGKCHRLERLFRWTGTSNIIRRVAAQVPAD